ncbi:uncharacterized protein SCODWIG_00907 [Saccharomycodes ludwigii]|uniref:ADF-H domain-containing protein n=1 Tax=Saccharomycodes ludwigii TaxID=36035 RepID=A0A376B382_9ASCO|nr:hypothetical protein SCDLUD_000523 [Saccharomycodes ludwigii]KAH3902927.1 hypothetical protein SCDLUD_000523 [Saccharomycodes ludwigii]SSD59146.1 uncharacterized protein SCODWIG_00907 [Saccharomycodes ludwigii]
MSTQSGILGDEKLLEAIAHNPSKQVILAQINKSCDTVQLFKSLDSIEELHAFLSNEESKNSNFESFYILVPINLNNSSSSATNNDTSYDFITYIPDISPVRQKMLYASSKLSLQRQIGTSKIGVNLLLNSVEELIPTNLRKELSESASNSDNQSITNTTGLKKIDVSVLSESELANLEISRQQYKQQLVSQTNGSGSQLSFKINDNGQDLLNGFFKPNNMVHNYNFISLLIDISSELVNATNESMIDKVSELPSKIITEHPTYSLYKSSSKNDNTFDQYFFIYSCPSGSKVKERMLYASNKQGLINHLTDQYGITFAKVIEIGDADELELSELKSRDEEEESSANNLNNRLKFNKPKGPPRRGGHK